MQAWMEALTRVSAMAAGSLVAAIWEGLLLAAAVALCLRLLPGITAAARSVVWLAVMLAVVGLPFLHVSGPSGAAVAGGWNGGWNIDERVSLAVLAVWMGLSAWRAVELIRSAVWLRGIARRATAVEAGPAVAALLGSRVRLCVSDEVDRPSVAGFLSPRILVPAALLPKLSDGELEQIVLHEMEHLRRRDDWTNLLQKLSVVLFPLNPVLLWIERRLCLERELACDDRVLRVTNARKAYAACLANLAEHSLVRRGVSLALGAWERQSELVSRVHRILVRPQREMGRRQAGFAVGAIIFGLAAGADGLAHSPRLVSFERVPASNQLAVVSGQPSRDLGFVAQPVVFHPPVAVKAVPVPVRKNRQRRNTGVLPFRVAQGQNDVNLRRVDAAFRGGEDSDPPVVVMVTWRFARPGAVMQSSQVSYAAVPVRDGWLFVQL
jgi:Zn-dependent protease with chaperone function